MVRPKCQSIYLSSILHVFPWQYPLTFLDKVIVKKYYSGRDIKPDEIIMFAFIKNQKNVIELIALHEDELDQYEFLHYPTDHIPEIKLK